MTYMRLSEMLKIMAPGKPSMYLVGSQKSKKDICSRDQAHVSQEPELQSIAFMNCTAAQRDQRHHKLPKQTGAKETEDAIW